MKKIVVQLLAFVMLTSIFGLFSDPVYASSKFAPWYMQDVLIAEEWGLVPSTFNAATLEQPITRGEFTEAAIRAYVRATGSLPEDYDKNVFSDTSTVYGEMAFDLGIISGYPDNTFRTMGKITREQMFAMVYNLSHVIESKVTLDASNETEALNVIESNFSDYEDLSRWAYESALYVVESGIVKGNDEKKLLPKAYTSRAQALVILKNAFEASEVEAVSTKKMNAVLRTIEKTAYQTSRGTRGRTDVVNSPQELLVKLGNNSVKHTLIFGSPDAPRYQTAAEALSNMATVTIPVWQLDAKGSKITGQRNLMVHKAISHTVKLIFDEIYDGPEQFPIKEVGGYAWRANKNSEHRWGLAIDINPNENYMIRSNGSIVAGSYWKPGVDPYSILPNGDVVNAFKKYGFTWGGDAWPTSRDYMHFSFLGE